MEFGATNRGIATATNHAMALATGEYIAMLDHDDEILPEALQEVAAVLQADPAWTRSTRIRHTLTPTADCWSRFTNRIGPRSYFAA